MPRPAPELPLMRHSGIRDEVLPIVELHGVSLSMDGRTAFPRTTWAVMPGAHWAIVGPNGSGKSALARALTGDADVLEGRILHPQVFGGEAVDPLSTNGFITYLSFKDQAGLVGRYSSYMQGRYESIEGDDAPRAAELLDLKDPVVSKAVEGLGLSSLLDRRIVHLSNGEMRKLLLARAICRAPRLLILEEPFMGLDARSREELSGFLERAEAMGVTLVTVTSRIKDVPRLVDNVLLVKDGKITARGRREDVAAADSVRPDTPGRIALPDSRHLRPIVQLRDVTVIYDGVRVLDGVTWTMGRGECWALAGPTGAGKTTLLSLILGDNPQAYANDVRVFGHKRGDGTSIWDLKRKLGHVSPEMQIHFFTDADVLRVICSGFSEGINFLERRTAGQISRARSLAKSLGLGGMLEERYDSLSEGHKRLVLIARAFVRHPGLVVLDEPCLGLDDAHREAVRGAVDTLCTGGAHSLIFVTHDPEDIPSCVTHLLRLEGGRVAFSGLRGAAPRQGSACGAV